MHGKPNWWAVALGILALALLAAASQTNDVGGRNMYVFCIPASTDSTFVDSTDFDTDGDGTCDFGKVTKVGIKYDNAGAGVDSFGIHLRRGWRTMPYPRGSIDVFEIQCAEMSEIHIGRTPAGAARQGEVLRLSNGSTGNAWLYVWGD